MIEELIYPSIRLIINSTINCFSWSESCFSFFTPCHF